MKKHSKFIPEKLWFLVLPALATSRTTSYKHLDSNWKFLFPWSVLYTFN